MARILFVEDNALNVDMLKRRLERRGHVVTVAGNGVEGVQLADTLLPDLILMDISLPIMDGWEATRLIKADPRTRGIPVLALTAHAMEEDRRKSLEAGCEDFDTKPVDFKRLMAKIDHLLAGKTS